MLRVIRDIQGPAFITGVLLVLVVGGMCGVATFFLSDSLLLAGVVCWALIVLIPFFARAVNMWLIERQAASQRLYS